jgi:hypothetical protein
MASANITFVSGVPIYNVSNTDDIINVDTSVYAVTIVFPNLVTTGLTKSYSVNDFTGNANTNNITIVAAGSIVNSGQVTRIVVDYGSAGVTPINQNEYLAITDNPSGGGSVSNVTAIAPITSSGGATPVISSSITENKLLGRGQISGTGVFQEIVLGTNLSLAGTTLNAAGGTTTYTNASSTTIAVGGIPLASTFPVAQTMQQMWDALLYPYTAPTLVLVSLTPASPVAYNELNVACAVTFRWTKGAGTPNLVSAQIQFRRGGAGAWTNITTTTSPSLPSSASPIDASSTVTVNSSGANNDSINFQCVWIDASQTNTTPTSSITFANYVAPIASLSLTSSPALQGAKMIRSLTTFTSITTNGTITRQSVNINMNTFKIQRSYDNSTYTDLIGLTASTNPITTLTPIVDTTPPQNRTAYYVKAFVTDTDFPAGQNVNTISSFGIYNPILYGVTNIGNPASALIPPLLSVVPNGLSAGQVNYTGTSADIVITGLSFVCAAGDFMTIAIPSSYSLLTAAIIPASSNLDVISNFIYSPVPYTSPAIQSITFGDGTIVSYNVYVYSSAQGVPVTFVINFS